MPAVIGGYKLPSPVRIGLTDLPNIGGASGPPGSPVPASLQKLLNEGCYVSVLQFFSKIYINQLPGSNRFSLSSSHLFSLGLGYLKVPGKKKN